MRKSPNVVSVGDTVDSYGIVRRITAILPQHVIVRSEGKISGKVTSWPYTYIEAEAMLNGR